MRTAPYSRITERGVVYCAGACTPAIGGAGVTKVAAAAAGTGVFTTSASGLSAATGYTFRAYATNSAGTAYSAGATFTTLAANAAPTASAGGPYTINEGASLALSAAGSSDPDGDALTYTWDVNGDGTYGDATGVSPTLTWAQLAALGLDGPTTRNVTVRVSDPSHPAVQSAAATLTVNNVAPTATANVPANATEGSQVTISLTGGTDASAADVTAGLHYAFDTNGDGTYGVGDGTYAGSPAGSSATFTAPDGPATLAVRLRVIDKDGGFVDYQKDVNVTNVAPDGTLGNDGPVVEGSPATIAFTGASDPSAGDRAAGFHYAFDLNDDGTYDIGDGTYANSPDTPSAPLPTDDNGVLTVAAAIIDRDGGITRRTTDVTVTNGPPTATIDPPTPTVAGSALELTFGATDPSSVDASDVFTYEVDWGDGVKQIVTGPNGAKATHTYPASGTYTISVFATDKDGDRSPEKTRDVVIAALPQAPRAAAAGHARRGDRPHLEPQRAAAVRAQREGRGRPRGDAPLPPQYRRRGARLDPAPQRQQLAQLPAGTRRQEAHPQARAGDLQPRDRQAGLHACGQQLARRRQHEGARLCAADCAADQGQEAASGHVPGDAHDARRQRPGSGIGQGQVLGAARVSGGCVSEAG